MSRRVSRADQALSNQLAKRDVEASPRQIESMRQAGLLEEANHPGLGRGRGSRSVRSPNEIERAEYMADLLDECGSYASAVLVGFVRDDYPIAKDRLERAYTESLGSIVKWMERRGGSATSAIDTAGNVAISVGRNFAKEQAFRLLRKRAKQLRLVDRQTPMHRAMYDVATDLVALLIVGKSDSVLTIESAGTLENLVGTEPVSGTHPTPPHSAPASATIAELASQLDLTGLANHVRRSSMRELETARDAAKTFRAFARAFAPFAKRRFGIAGAFAWLVAGNANDRTVAYAIPGFVWLRRIRGQKLDALIAFMAEWTPYFATAHTILDHLPRDLQVIVQPGGYQSLTPSQQRQLADCLAHLETAHPFELRRVTNPPDAPQLLG